MPVHGIDATRLLLRLMLGVRARKLYGPRLGVEDDVSCVASASQFDSYDARLIVGS